ncbi:MAG: glycosyltransferase family 39 protein [Tepidisphaeraceae bacterium]|jgi:hypothetical protein
MTTQSPITSDSETSAWKYRLAAWCLIVIGIAVRVRVYLGNRSLERDEAALAYNIIHRGFFGLFKQLDNDQAAPVGFLLVQKMVVCLLGPGEHALRLFPLLASIAGLVVFWFLCRRILTPRAAVIALAVIALSAKQFFYASQTKQYSTDVLVAVAMLLLTHGWVWDRATEPLSRRRRAVLACGGAAAVWFSHPAIFILGGIAAVGAWEYFQSADRRTKDFAIVMGAWAFSFALNYIFVLHRLSHHPFMQTFWSAAGAFAPFPKSPGALIWYKKNLFEIFEDPLSLAFAGLAALAYAMGLVAWWRGKKSLPAVMVAPILFALAASILHKFPFKSRMILFLTPLLAAGVGTGIDLLCSAPAPQRYGGVLALVFLLISPFTTALDYARHPPQLHEMRDALAFVAAHNQPGDVYYVYPFCAYAFNYYQPRFGLAAAAPIVGTSNLADWNAWEKELSPLAGHRVWIFFEDPSDHDGVNDEQMALRILSGMGREVCRDEPFGEFVACYDLRH